MYDDKIDDWKIYFIMNHWLKILVTNLHKHVDLWIKSPWKISILYNIMYYYYNIIIILCMKSIYRMLYNNSNCE